MNTDASTKLSMRADENLLNIRTNKTVLLRERKRHTDRGVSSTPSALLYRGGGTPPPGYNTSVLTWLGGVTPSLPGGTPPQAPPPSDLAGVPPQSDLAGVPPTLGVDRQTDTCQNITFPSYYVRGR